MAQGMKSREETIRESIDAPVAIDTSVSFIIPRTTSQFDSKKHKYKCSCCGKGFSTQKGHFHKTNSPLYQCNDGYLPWCTDCEDKYYAQLVALYSGNEEQAIKLYCEQVDWCYEINPLVASYEYEIGHQDRTRLSHYAARKNLNVEGRKTYIDTLKNEYVNRQSEVITSREQAKSEDSIISASAVDRWGIGLEELDYKNLDDHYRYLKKNNPNADANQEIFIKTLSTINLLMIKASRDGDSDKYVKLAEQYNKTFTKAGLKTIQEVDNSADECLGVTLAAIAQYTPEEYYKNKSIYQDFDGIGDYFERFVKRPLKNLMFGTNERDKEFCVKEDSDLDE